ncbi:hypothetical protein [Labrys neptuniae]
MPHFITKTCFGRYGVSFGECDVTLTRKAIVERFVNGEFDPGDKAGQGLLQVLEIDPAVGSCKDVTRMICLDAEHYISANELHCDGNRLRLMQDYKVVPIEVAEIVEGRWLVAAPSRIAAE